MPLRRWRPITQARSGCSSISGVPPYRETHAYVARVITDYNRKKLAEARPQSTAPATQHKASVHRSSATSNTKAQSVPATGDAHAGSE